MNESTHEIVLTDDESAAIQKALLSYLRDLRGEIADTDNPAYKRELREERATLESAIAKLGGPSSGGIAPAGAGNDREVADIVVLRVVGLRWTT
jgi:hypothetical protein